METAVEPGNDSSAKGDLKVILAEHLQALQYLISVNQRLRTNLASAGVTVDVRSIANSTTECTEELKVTEQNVVSPSLIADPQIPDTSAVRSFIAQPTAHRVPDPEVPVSLPGEIGEENDITSFDINWLSGPSVPAPMEQPASAPDIELLPIMPVAVEADKCTSSEGLEVMDGRTSRTSKGFVMTRAATRPRGTQIFSISTDDMVAFLSEVSLFKGLSVESHKALCKACEECKFTEGEVIIKQGDKGNEFFLIFEGEVSVVVDGWKVASLTIADYFGDCALMHNETRTATVMAETDVKCLRITREMFTELGLKDEVHFPAAQWSSIGIPKTRQVFADAAAMKEKLRERMMKPVYDVRNFYWTSGHMQRIARSTWFDNITLSVIAFNALWIAIDTDHNTNDMLIHSEPIFILAENFFCLYFSAEWFIRFCSFRRKRDGFRDPWFVFDSALVFVMIVETWLMNAVVLAIGGSSSSVIGDASILRLFRLLRLSRMARMARLLRAIPELLVLIKGMVVAMRSVFFTLLLLGGIIYIFAIAFVQLMKDTPVGDQYFPRVPEAMNALLLDGVLPDQAGVVESVGSQGVFFKFLILVYILFASLTVMNMLVGVLCEVVSVVADVEKESLLVNYVKTTLLNMLESTGLDADGDYLIDKYEFQQLLDIPLAAKALSDVGVDVIGLVDFTDYIFKGDQKLTFPDFMEVILQLRGTNNATVKDLVDLRKVVIHEMEKFSSRQSEIFIDTLESFMTNGPMQRAARLDDQPNRYGSKDDYLDGAPKVKALDGNRAASPTGVTVDGLQGNTWAVAACIRLNAAATELSAAAGALSTRGKSK